MKWALLAQGEDGSTSLVNEMKSACKGLEDLDRLDVAVAYATLQGVKALEIALGGIPSKSRWIIGIDDAITQPEALEYLAKLPGSKVRIASMAPAKRFHPKLYCLWSSSADDRCVSAVGSGNMTLNGLRRNGETAVILSAESWKDAVRLKKQWKGMWQLGHVPSSEELEFYGDVYKKAKKQRKKIVDLGMAPPEPKSDAPVDEEPSYNGNPASAHVAWLEAGTPSAGGRDLEFPKQMMPFFALKKNKEDRKFRIATGLEHTLTFTERTNNQMWRLLFSNASIQAAIGRDTMRPKTGGNRSDLAVLFRRVEGSKNFEVEMLKLNSSEFKALVKKSNSVDGVFLTRNPGGRKFGFY